MVTFRRVLLLSQIPFWIVVVLAFHVLSATLDTRVAATARTAAVRDELARVAQIMQLVVDMETGLRGYVIAGNAVFLEPYTAARAALPGDLRALRAAVARPDDADGQKVALGHIARIEALVATWQSTVAQPEIDARTRQQDAAALVKTQNGKRLLDAIRREVRAYTADRTASLRAHEAVAARDLQRLRATLVAAAALMVAASAAATLFGATLVTRALAAVTGAARAVSGGRSARVDAPPAAPAEIRVLAGAFNAMGERLDRARDDTGRHAAQLAARNVWLRDLHALSDGLQSARSVAQAADVLCETVPALLPGTSGTLREAGPDGRVLVAWGDGPAGPGSDVVLASHGETVGTLRVHVPDGAPVLTPDTAERVAEVARVAALAVANLRLHDRLTEQSLRDPLTGLHNRRHLDGQLRAACDAAARRAATPWLLALDLDHFKRLNDTFGHDAGDHVLVQVARVLERHCPDGGTAARPGGEEFAVLVPDADPRAAAALAERVRAEVAALDLRHAGRALGQVTVSAGLAAAGDGTGGPDALARAADEALYAAKRAGRDRVVLAGRQVTRVGPVDASRPA